MMRRKRYIYLGIQAHRNFQYVQSRNPLAWQQRNQENMSAISGSLAVKLAQIGIADLLCPAYY